MFKHRTSRVLAVAAMAFGGLAPLSFVLAGPAAAYDGNCVDWAIAQPTAVHSTWSDTTGSSYLISSGTKVSGDCYYVNNTSEAHWYMEMYTSRFSSGFGYIWVQRLSYGSSHSCDDDGHAYAIAYGNGNCRLVDN
jgi:hypothetical protein